MGLLWDYARERGKGREQGKKERKNEEEVEEVNCHSLRSLVQPAIYKITRIRRREV